ncbi:MAG: hypothetical protein ACTSPY_11505 [Candidatus Helarchaeota archaeon]
MIKRKKLYSILCFAEITMGIIFIISIFIEIFLLKILAEYNIIKNIYVIFLFVATITCILGGLLSLGILAIIGCIPSLVCMLILINDRYFWEIFRPDILIFLIISIGLGILLIIFYKEYVPEIKTEIKDMQLNELKNIKRKQIEKLNLIGIVTLKDLIEEEGNIKEISRITDIDRNRLKLWLREAIELEKEYYDYKKDQLKKSYWKKIKKK